METRYSSNVVGVVYLPDLTVVTRADTQPARTRQLGAHREYLHTAPNVHQHF